jgi:phosphoribosylformylglycinamidine cyclo-ligase
MSARAAYRAAGVDVEAGDRAVALIRERLARAAGESSSQADWPVVLGAIGGFGSAVALPPGYREPILVSATDGVGTKTAIASALGRYETIGHDLVAMCADDVVCSGARPLFMLDYVAAGRVQPERVAELVGGIVAGCELAGCALVGGETAEHPGVLEADEFDLAGFCLGVVEREARLDGSSPLPGDVLIGLASSGLQSNGYSLVRSLVTRHQLDLGVPYMELIGRFLGEGGLEDASAAEPELALATLGDVLLTPSRIYARDALALRDELDGAGTPLRSLAHITGGGLPGNVPRALPPSLAARVDPGSWEGGSIFRLVAYLAALEGEELRATLNSGLGMVAVVPAEGADRALRFLAGRGVPAWQIGEVVPAADGTRYVETTR